MGILQVLEGTVLKYVKDKVKLGSLTKEQLVQIISLQNEQLSSIQKSMLPFDKTAMHSLYSKYRDFSHNTNDKNDISKYFLSLSSHLKGNAASKENAHPFITVIATAATLQKVLGEISKNVDKIVTDESLTVFNCRISGVMTLGILREVDVFTQTAFILWKHFTDTCFNNNASLLGYQADYVRQNFEKYVNIINDVLSKEHNYSFMQDVGDLQRKHTDMVLYANDQSFLHLLNPANLTRSAYHHLEFGILGFGVFTWVMQKYDDWQHSRYLKNKDFKAWLEARATLLKMELNNVDRNSHEYQKLLQIIQAYDAKIVEYDRKVVDYERS